MSLKHLIECLDALPNDAKLHVNPTLTMSKNAFGDSSSVFIKSDDVITAVAMKQLTNDHTALVAELTKEKEAHAVTDAILKDAYEIGKTQGEEWDRYWQAAGVGTSEITVDDAIRLWQRREDELTQLRALAEAAVLIEFADGSFICTEDTGKWSGTSPLISGREFATAIEAFDALRER